MTIPLENGVCVIDKQSNSSPKGFAQKVGVSDPLARYARVSPSRGGEYISRNARVIPLLVRAHLSKMRIE
jgi:hypothetical protein